MADRILIYGVTGAGKTTLAARLAERTGLPWHSVDDLTWDADWTEVPLDEQRRRIAAICAGDRWILDTAYSRWSEIPLARTDLIVALDYPRLVSLRRLVVRTARRLVTREPACNGNIEKLGQAVSRDSIVVFHFRSFARKRACMRAWEADPTGPPVLRFTSPRATERWLANINSVSIQP